MYITNRFGLRAQSLDDDELGDFRIAVFGDSFTHGDEVAYDDTWAHLLETRLALEQLPKSVCVHNGGVQGYGADQAWLRYQSVKEVLVPDVVILGLAPTAFKRNVNIFRLLVGEWTSWTKPRFVLDEGELTLINRPTMALDGFQAVIRGKHPWISHEFWYDPVDWNWSLADESVLYRFLKSRWRGSDVDSIGRIASHSGLLQP